MIHFKCPSCREEFKVARHHAGKSGKCKKCNSIITVPNQDEIGISFDSADITHADPDLQRVYSALIGRRNEQIVRHAIHEQLIILEFRCGDWGERTQSCVIATLTTDELGKCMYISSTVGTIDSAEHAYAALRAISSIPLLSVNLDESHELTIRALLPMSQTTDGILQHFVELVAKSADKLEELLFGYDLS